VLVDAAETRQLVAIEIRHVCDNLGARDSVQLSSTGAGRVPVADKQYPQPVAQDLKPAWQKHHRFTGGRGVPSRMFTLPVERDSAVLISHC